MGNSQFAEAISRVAILGVADCELGLRMLDGKRRTETSTLEWEDGAEGWGDGDAQELG